jgi:hypothetical protein
MPLALPDLQAALAAHVMGRDRADLVAAVVGDTIPADARLRVYRHHISHSLCAALAATFPTVQALVGEGFFRTLAQSFVSGALPAQPVLAEYGADFPAFVATYEPARTLPYLADIARLDWALNVAFHSPEGRRLAATDLAGIAAERLPSLSLGLPEGASLIRSHYPIDRIWTAAQPGAPADTVDLDAGRADLLVLRRADDAAFIVLDAGEAIFVTALAGGLSLEIAEEQTVSTEPGFDLSTAFARLLTLRAFAALQQDQGK